MLAGADWGQHEARRNGDELYWHMQQPLLWHTKAILKQHDPGATFNLSARLGMGTVRSGWQAQGQEQSILSTLPTQYFIK